MIPYHEALSIILNSVSDKLTENVSIQEAINRTSAADVYSDVNMPPFDKAAMDGYACKLADIANELEVVEEIPAGKVPVNTINTGQCAKIMTGAVVPAGADCVIMVEHTEPIGTNKIKFTKEKTSKNICYLGEDVKKGQLVLTSGTLLGAQHIAILASVGCSYPTVYKRPTIAILSTGSELVEPHNTPKPSQIRNSNGYQLFAQCSSMGITPHYAGIVDDEKDSIRNSLEKLLNNFDVVIVSGGVSMGEYDYVPEVLKELGVNILLQGMKIKPGKRIIAGKNGNKNNWVFGMPGNPVSSFVLFEVLVKPFLLKFEGKNTATISIQLPIAEDYNRKDSDKLSFIPVTITANRQVKSVEYNGSAHIHAYTFASGIMAIPEGINSIKKGQLVYVRPI